MRHQHLEREEIKKKEIGYRDKRNYLKIRCNAAIKRSREGRK